MCCGEAKDSGKECCQPVKKEESKESCCNSNQQGHGHGHGHGHGNCCSGQPKKNNGCGK